MQHPHLRPDPAEHERRRAALEDDQEEADRREAELERAADHGSVAFWHAAVHRLARRERRRRAADHRDAA